ALSRRVPAGPASWTACGPQSNRAPSRQETSMSVAPHARPPASGQRGIVLAAALLVILLSSVLVLTLMLTTVGERSQSSNVQTAKLALYAADAGVRTQQQLLANFAKVKMDSCLATWTAAGNPSQ